MTHTSHMLIDIRNIMGSISFGQGLDTSRRKSKTQQLVHEKLNRIEKGIQSDTRRTQQDCRAFGTDQSRQNIDSLGCSENTGTFDDGFIRWDQNILYYSKRDNLELRCEPSLLQEHLPKEDVLQDSRQCNPSYRSLHCQ